MRAIQPGKKPAHPLPPARVRAELEDDALREEIELLADVIAEVGHRTSPLDRSEVDRILGITDEESS